MRIRDLVKVMQDLAPAEYAEPWDKVGLLAGDAEAELHGPVVLTIDLTEAVLAEAIGLKAGAIVAYHPPIFEPLARVTSATPRQRVILRAIQAGMAIYSPHTALDAIPGGVTDWLCEGLSGGEPGRILGDCRALLPHAKSATTQELKIVTFLPADAVERVRHALATAGAGIIGAYTVCSFAVPGSGTFLGGEGTSPRVGEAGRLEQVAEVRLEMVCSKAALPLALETLSRFHPYEEPAVDVYELLGRPQRHHGPGRRIVLDQPATVAELAERLKKHLNIQVVNVAMAHDQDRAITHIGVCPGSGASLAAAARADGCDVYITGEMQHHDVIASLHSGLSLILAGHTNTERGYLPRLARRLESMLSGVSFKVSAVDKSPRVPV